VRNIENEQAVGVGVTADKTKSRSTLSTARKQLARVYIHSDSTFSSLSIAVALGRLPVDIFDMSIGRISSGEELELVEKERRLVVINHRVHASTRSSIAIEEFPSRSTLRSGDLE